MGGDGGRAPDVSEQRAETEVLRDLPCPRCSGQGVEEVPARGSWEEYGTVYAECRKCNGTGVLTGQGHIAECRDCDGSGRSAGDPDPASVLAALLAEHPDATIAALETLLTSDLRAVTLDPAWNRVDGRAWAGATRSDMAEVVIRAACRSLRPKAPKEDR